MPYSRFHVVLSCAEQLGCIQQVLVNSRFIFILLQILSNFPCSWLLRRTQHLKVDTYFLNTQGF